MASVHIRALTALRRTRLTSSSCPSAWQANPGRGSTYRRGKSVQRIGTTAHQGWHLARSLDITLGHPIPPFLYPSLGRPIPSLPWDDQYPLHHRAIDQSLREGKNSPQNRPQFGLKLLNRQNIFGFERPRGRRDTLYCSPFFDSISHPIGQDPMILCINAQAASSGDLA